METKINAIHESAIKHVSGKSIYIDDINFTNDTLIGKVVFSTEAHAEIKSINIEEALKVPGVVCILNYKDITGANQMGAVFHDELCLAENKVECIGQAILLIAADCEKNALKAIKLIEIEYKKLASVLCLEDAIKKNNLIGDERIMKRGDVAKAKLNSDNILKDRFETGHQEHWYLETQISLAIPKEDNEIFVYSSTQHPSETQTIISEVLGINKNSVTVECKRMGGAFGGKETQANWIAAWSSILAFHCKKPVKLKLTRDEDQKVTGKRHPFIFDYEVGFNKDGKLQFLDIIQHTDAGCATDLTYAILERAMLHNDNCYFIPNVKIIGRAYKTNLPSNTAFRGFGGPQGISCIENIIDQISRKLNIDSAKVRKINFYNKTNNVTHYGQLIKNNKLNVIYNNILRSSNYTKRKLSIDKFNKQHEFYKKGIAIVPVKFGISFTTTHLNQAGSIVHIYTDGSILISHGGTEMGQGLHTKIMKIAALELGIDINNIKISATNTSKVANTSATAASTGTDLNGMAVKNAIDQIKYRLYNLAKEMLNTNEDLVFENNLIYVKSDKSKSISFVNIVKEAYFKRINLSANGFYKTPNIGWDKIKGWGTPFSYYAYGMCVSEIILDTLTGYVRVLKTDILHDCGNSIIPQIDIGQIQGAYIQGLGWCTTEECKYKDGNLLNYSPDTYKIPSIQDIPIEFNVSLLENSSNSNAIRKSKAVAEPPFMYGLASWLAIKYAISSIKNHKFEPKFKIPATNETILLSIENINNAVK